MVEAFEKIPAPVGMKTRHNRYEKPKTEDNLINRHQRILRTPRNLRTRTLPEQRQDVIIARDIFLVIARNRNESQVPVSNVESRSIRRVVAAKGRSRMTLWRIKSPIYKANFMKKMRVVNKLCFKYAVRDDTLLDTGSPVSFVKQKVIPSKYIIQTKTLAKINFAEIIILY